MAMSPEEKRRKICERAQKWWLLNKERANENKRQWRQRKRLGLQEKRKTLSPEERRQKACERTRKWLLLNKERSHETKRQWRLNHPDENKKRKKQWYLQNRDEIRKRVKESDTPARREAAKQQSKEWYRAHKEQLRHNEEWHKKRREAVKRHTKRHPDKKREYEKAHAQERREQLRKSRRKDPERTRLQYLKDGAKRRAAILKAGGSFTVDDIARIYALQKGKCAGCGIPFKITGSRRYAIDHIIPLQPADGGKPGSNGPENIQLLCDRCNCQKRNLHPDEWNRRRKAG